MKLDLLTNSTVVDDALRFLLEKEKAKANTVVIENKERLLGLGIAVVGPSVQVVQWIHQNITPETTVLGKFTIPISTNQHSQLDLSIGYTVW
jgi:hypothetical protein